MDRGTIIRDGLRECEALARREGWTGPWEQQPADLEWIADRLRDAGLGLPGADDTHAYTSDELAEIGVALAFRAHWLAPSPVSAAAAALGRMGRGETKRRGDADHYRALAARRKTHGRGIHEAREYRGVMILPCSYADSLQAGYRWWIAAMHPATGIAYGEHDSARYYTLAEAKEAVREAQTTR